MCVFVPSHLSSHAFLSASVKSLASTLASSPNHHPPTTSLLSRGSNSRTWIESSHWAEPDSFGGEKFETESPEKAGAMKPPLERYPTEREVRDSREETKLE